MGVALNDYNNDSKACPHNMGKHVSSIPPPHPYPTPHPTTNNDNTPNQVQQYRVHVTEYSFVHCDIYFVVGSIVLNFPHASHVYHKCHLPGGDADCDRLVNNLSGYFSVA